MAQSGLHGLIGLGIVWLLRKRLKPATEGAVVAGVIVGSMFPDIDLYVRAVATLLGDSNAKYYHRQFTHSLVALASVLVVGLVFLALRRRTFALAMVAVFIGVASHIVVDLFLWFDSVVLLWPFSAIQYTLVNREPTKLFDSLMFPSDYVALVLYFVAFAAILKQEIRMHSYWTWALISFLFGAVLYATTPNMEKDTAMKLVFGPFLLLFLPICWLAPISNRRSLCEWFKSRRTAPV